jgi:hypothetical protein
MPDQLRPKPNRSTTDEETDLDRLAASFQTERDDIRLPVHCSECNEPVTLILTAWPSFLNGVTMAASDPPPGFVQRWTCPHCQAKNEGGFPGRMTLARKGHQAP